MLFRRADQEQAIQAKSETLQVFPSLKNWKTGTLRSSRAAVISEQTELLASSFIFTECE